MKASYHNSRKYNNPKHNDRTFLDKQKEEDGVEEPAVEKRDGGKAGELASHIDRSRSRMNQYVCVHSGMDFESAEKKFYAENFGKYVEQRNESVRKSRHKERKQITTNDLWENPRTRPEETIIQIGDINNQPDDPMILLRVFNELQKYSNKITRKHCKILDAAIHMDESTPHIHFRKVWVYEENGIKKISEEKSLERAGIERPNPDRPSTKWNNRKMTYDRMMRQKLYELCIEHGLDIDIVPDLHNRVHLEKNDYVNKKIREERERAEEERRRRREERQKKPEEKR